MIAHLAGTLLDKRVQRLIVDVHGVGYEVHVPLSTFYGIGDAGGEVSLHIHTHVREDALLLYGFGTTLELDLFERLISVSGIGPKVGLSVLSGMEPRELVRAIRQGDLGRLTLIPGVGKKTAERMVLELRDRMPAPSPTEAGDVEPGGTVRDDLLSALANLGYQRAAAEKAVDRVVGRATGDPVFEPLLREALKELAR